MYKQLIDESNQVGTKMREALLASRRKVAILTSLQEQILVIAEKNPLDLSADDRRTFETVQVISLQYISPLLCNQCL